MIISSFEFSGLALLLAGFQASFPARDFFTMPHDAETLSDISQFVACDLDLIQGGGGNTSVKSADGKLLYIKSSGYRLRDLNAEKGYCILDLPALKRIVEDESYTALEPLAQQERSAREMLKYTTASAFGRPSLETGFHALLNTIVIHTHPVSVNIGTSTIKGLKLLIDALRAEGKEPLWIPYRMPGHPLARAVSQGLVEYMAEFAAAPEILLLENHGLIVTTDSAESCKSLHQEVNELAWKVFGKPEPVKGESKPSSHLIKSIEIALSKIQGRPYSVREIADRDSAATLAQSPSLAAGGPIVPDDAVYWSGQGIVIPEQDCIDLDSALQAIKGAKPSAYPSAILILCPGFKPLLAMKHENGRAAVEESIRAHVRTRMQAQKFGGARSLPDEEIELLYAMEGEKFRQQKAYLYNKGR